MNGEVVTSEWITEDAVFGAGLSCGFAEDERALSIKDYRDLEVWKCGMAIAKSVYDYTADVPREELYGLASQMRRASVSIPANIAEGYDRGTTGAFIHFLRIAQGSLKELETLTELSSQLGFLTADGLECLTLNTIQLSKCFVPRSEHWSAGKQHDPRHFTTHHSPLCLKN